MPSTRPTCPSPPSGCKQLSEQGARILATSKWLNTATIALTDTTLLSDIAQLPFVARFDRLGSPVQPTGQIIVKPRKKLVEAEPLSFYGEAAQQIALHNGERLHQAGFRGEGMIIAVIDGGFLNTDRNPQFDPDRIVGGTRLYRRNDGFPQRRQPRLGGAIDPAGERQQSVHRHGSAGLLLAAAVGRHATEYPTEEDYWAAALEYADSLGVDVVTSSLGYSRFDDSRYDHTWDDLDGHTTFISQAAARGVEKGLLIVVSAGNERINEWQKITFPADVAGVLSVGAVSTNRQPAYFSGAGPTADGRVKPDVVAIGAPAAIIDPDGNLQWQNGTSFSAPIMAGLTACLWQALPKLSAREIISLIQQNSSQYLAPDSLLGYGIPDFYAAYRQGQP